MNGALFTGLYLDSSNYGKCTINPIYIVKMCVILYNTLYKSYSKKEQHMPGLT